MDWYSISLGIAWIVIFLYTLALVMVFVFSATQAYLALKYTHSKKYKSESPQLKFNGTDSFPAVTIQLPIFNELYVIKRLLTAITALEYPKELLEIQVLDDSTDESVALTAQLVADYQNQGFTIEHLRRKERTGFKAGALKAGLTSAEGTLIAIFDADFIPPKDWLLRTVPYFKDEKIGVVQTRWGHLNANYSL